MYDPGNGQLRYLIHFVGADRCLHAQRPSQVRLLTSRALTAYLDARVGADRPHRANERLEAPVSA